MQSHTLILAVAALSVPLALTGLNDHAAKASSPQATESAPASQWQLAQATGTPGADASFSNTVHGRPLETAPVPGALGGGVAPAERAGGTETVANGAGPINSTPFSGAPSAQRSANDPTASRDQAGSAEPLTPSLGR